MGPQPTLHHPKYRGEIDGLRAIAVLSVVLYHAFPKFLTGGFIGVDVFFVISGYLISTIIIRSLEEATFSFRTFYARRITRIFPALLVVLVSVLIIGWLILLADEMNQLGLHTLAGAGFVSNFIFWGEVRYFDTAADAKPLLHLWSLSIEEQFYILWPLLVWLLWRWKVLLSCMIFCLIMLSFLLNVSMVADDPVGAFYSPFVRSWELLSGALIASLESRREASATSRYTWRWVHTVQESLPNAASGFGLILIFCGLLVLEKGYSFPGYWALLPVVGSMLMIAAGPSGFVNRRFLSSRTMVWFGLISFPLYLWHWPLLSFAHIVYADSPPKAVRVFLVVLSVLLAWLTLKSVERPIRISLRPSYWKVATLTVSLFIVGLVGLTIGNANLTVTHTTSSVVIARPPHALGASMAWYHGKDNWLFLGNAYDDSVAKLKLAEYPSDEDMQEVQIAFSELSAAAAQSGTSVALLVGPNKESIYPEFLPDAIEPSPRRYSSYFLDELRRIPNLIVYDPTDDLLKLKLNEGLLYFRTDTHWNSKGAFLALTEMLHLVGAPIVSVRFSPGKPYRGDLVDIAQLRDFPLQSGDSWDAIILEPAEFPTMAFSQHLDTPFTSELIQNDHAISDKAVWVVGDSFSKELRPYLNATFREVRYVGHWKDSLTELPVMLQETSDPPNLILIVRVERSF